MVRVVKTTVDATRIAQIKQIICKYFGDECNLATRVFKAESGLNPNAIGDHGSSLGIAQINRPHWGKVSCNLLEPECNIKLAKAIRDDSGWWAWSVYKNGTY